ncbi:unnamed protein product [Camellia sinensis]
MLLSHPTQISDYSFHTLALPLIFILFVSLFSLYAISTITYITYHDLYVILLLVLVLLQVNWALACVIVVMESKWEFELLWRSTYLMKGMRLVSLYLMLFFGAVIRVVWACLGTFLGSFSDVWKSFSFVLQIVMGSSIVALHGELAGDIAVVGRLFGISIISAIRVGLLLAPGGEFAFVAFGEAVNKGIMVDVAITPKYSLNVLIVDFLWLVSKQMICRTISLSVDLDVLARHTACIPGHEVLHKVGAERACATAITLDTPGANYRTVWALSKYFPNVKTFVCANDVDHGLILEKVEATAVVPETLEPSLQLAAAVLVQAFGSDLVDPPAAMQQLKLLLLLGLQMNRAVREQARLGRSSFELEAKLPMSEIKAIINKFRSHHLSELTELSEASGGSLGYGYSRIMSKPKSQPFDSSDDNQITEGTLVI